MEDSEKQIPIWFFIGSILTIYGVLILGYGIYSLFNPPEHTVALAHLHADIWWGAIILVIGMIYGIKYWPHPSKGK